MEKSATRSRKSISPEPVERYARTPLFPSRGDRQPAGQAGLRAAPARSDGRPGAGPPVEPDRSRAIIDQDHAACLCRDAVAVMLDHSPALDSGPIAAAQRQTSAWSAIPPSRRSRRQSENSALKATRTERRLRSESPEPPDPPRLGMAIGVRGSGYPPRVFFPSFQNQTTQIAYLSDVTARSRHGHSLFLPALRRILDPHASF